MTFSVLGLVGYTFMVASISASIGFLMTALFAGGRDPESE